MAGLRAAGAASRAELARRTGLSRTTVASIVADLEREGMLDEREDGTGASPQGGRPPRLINPEVWPAYAARFEAIMGTHVQRESDDPD